MKLNRGALGRFLYFVAAFLCVCACGAAARMPALPAGAENGVFDIRAFGAVADGHTDNTAAIQRAIDAAHLKGGIVFVPPGEWLCRGHIELKAGVHLKGVNEAPQSWEPRTGSILEPTEGRGHEDAPAFIEMRSSTSVTGLTVYYPEQTVDDIQAYPWTIQIRGDPANAKDVSFDSTVSDVTLINSYNGIRTGPTENGRHRILNVHGCVLRRGILIDWTGDIGRIENVQFHSHFWAGASFKGNWDKVFNYMQQNLEAFVFGRTDWEYVTNTFVFPAKTGYRFIETANGSMNGQLSGIGADATQVAVMVEAIQSEGLQITNGEFDSHHIGASTQVVVGPHSNGSVRFVNSAFWGPTEHNAFIQGDGFVSFSDCYFSSDFDARDAAVVVESGRVQIQNSTFDARSKQLDPGHASDGGEVRYQQPSIRLASGVRSAILRGNNGYYGVRIENQIGDRAIIGENEPYRAPGAEAANKDKDRSKP
jgi:hypothetical protein